jgi:hypothetical protein
MTVLETELADIKARLARLEVTVTALTPRSVTARRKRLNTPSDKFTSMSNEELLARLKADGLIVDPPPMIREAAAEWEALSTEEKAAVCQALDNLPPGPLVSDIIIENRR